MFVVIFRAEVNQLDAQYEATATRMRDLALQEFGCLEFTACMEGDTEIAISYWPDEAHIAAWRANAEHLAAQAAGRDKWYRSYRVQVLELVREYGSDAASPSI